MIKNKLLWLSLLVGFSLEAKQFTSRNTILYRPYLSSIKELMDPYSEFILDTKDNDYRFSFNALVDYSQSFKSGCKKGCSNDFNSYAFWSGGDSLTIGKNQGTANIDGFNLGLGYNFPVDSNGIAGKLTLHNTVRQIGTDLKLYYEHNKNESSFYMKLHAPIVSLTVNSCLTENPQATPDPDFMQTATTTTTTINFANANYLLPQDRYVSASQFFLGGINDCTSMDGSRNKSIRLTRGFVSKNYTVVRVADLQASVGYYLLTKEKNQLSLGFTFTCPTGNVPSAYSIFEPIVGRFGSWGVGAEAHGHYKVWESTNNNRACYVNMQAELLHLIPNRKPNFRSFDLLQNGVGSKYLLVQEYVANSFVNPVVPTIYETRMAPATILPAINITTLPIKSKINLEGSIAGQFKYVHDDKWTLAINGELYARSQEKIVMDINSIIDFKNDSLNNYAVIGRQVGKYQINDNTNTNNQELYANLCEPLATINKSQDPIQLVGNVASVTVPTTLPEGIADATISSNRIPAEFKEALDICGAQAPRVISGTVLLSAQRVWPDVSLLPSVSVFGGVELTSNNSLPQFWTVGVSGNIQF